MFQINDDFLANVGYDVATLSEERKAEYVEEFSEDFRARLLERVTGELDVEQINDFDRVQSSIENTRAWLDEFHTDYRDSEDYRQIVQLMDDEDEATIFYASELWMRDAIPNYHDVIQEELNAYQAHLIEQRQRANELLAELG